MSDLYPLLFHPVLMERVWGGRRLHTVCRRNLTSVEPHGESWEICDRFEEQSIIRNGDLSGARLQVALSEWGTDAFFGTAYSDRKRLPLLYKILDASELLSVQVHPHRTRFEPGEEVKTECWYVAEADEGAYLYAGFSRATNKEELLAALKGKNIPSLLRKIMTKTNDMVFIPSGRIHTIGPGNLIIEIQENSDTTYRVYDWDRTGLDDKPRQLHLKESLRSIDFDDVENPVQVSQRTTYGGQEGDQLVSSEAFSIWRYKTEGSAMEFNCDNKRYRTVIALDNKLQVRLPDIDLLPVKLNRFDFCLIPAGISRFSIESLVATDKGASSFLLQA